MGRVYRTLDEDLGEPVALKVLLIGLTRDATAIERFRREVRLARRVTHPNVVRTHDLGNHEGVHYLTMEWVEGKPLDLLLRERGPLPSQTVLGGRQHPELALAFLELADDRALLDLAWLDGCPLLGELRKEAVFQKVRHRTRQRVTPLWDADQRGAK